MNQCVRYASVIIIPYNGAVSGIVVEQASVVIDGETAKVSGMRDKSHVSYFLHLSQVFLECYEL